MRLARSRRRRLFAPLTLAVLALTPAAANATVTSSQITTPAAPVFGAVDDNVSGDKTFAIAGTSNGTTGDEVDVRCFYTWNQQRNYDTVRSNVAVNADGTFSVPDADLNSLPGTSCVLRAVPAGVDPTFLAAFAGPTMHVGRIEPLWRDSTTDSVFGYGISQPQLKGSMYWQAAGSCGLTDTAPYAGGNDFAMVGDAEPWECAAALYPYDGIDSSEIVADGHFGYDAYRQHEINGAAAGFAPLSVSSSVNPANGNLTITETSEIRRCVDADGNAVDISSPYGSCADFVPTGVTLERTIVQDHEGLMATITDRWISTDGAAHKLKLGYDTYSYSDYENPTYRLPGAEAYSQRDSYQTAEGVAAAPATMHVRVVGGYGAAAYGGLTYTTAPDGIVWRSREEFVARYTRDVPAGGELRLTQIYTQAVSDAQARSLAQAAEDKVVGPSVSITSPANGSTVTGAAQTVTGTATDNKGVTSLTVNGRPVTPGAGGAFSAPLTLAPGQNTITVVAGDAEGNSTQAQAVVTYVPPKAAKTCTVPKVTKKTLTAAKKAIKKAGCVVGKVKAKASKKVKPGRVISQGRKAGAKVAIGTKVALTVSKPKPAKKAGRKATGKR